MAILHALANVQSIVPPTPGSFLDRFFANTKALDPAARAAYLENDAEIETFHTAAASEGDTAPPDLDTRVVTRKLALRPVPTFADASSLVRAMGVCAGGCAMSCVQISVHLWRRVVICTSSTGERVHQ